jgi:AmmeMemoRadiSam system protein B
MPMRGTAVAGTWYPDTPSRLTAELDRHLSLAARGAPHLPAGATLMAVVAPHAGLTYSGPVAAYAYSLLAHRSFETVVLVGPSHYVGFDGVSVWTTDAFDTPLGRLAIDEARAERLVEQCRVAVDLPEAHAREHSLEMQLPFIAYLTPSARIVPVVMGFQTRATVSALAEAIVSILEDGRVLLVASSDLSHFYDAGTAVSLDSQVIADVEALDDEGLMARLERKPDHACGGGPIAAVMRAARASGAQSARALHYGDSGDVTGDKRSVVGYLAAAIWR